MRKFYQLRRFVLALSGAHEEVLELVPSEQARFESLGWAILITSCMAVISMWFALANALSINGILAIPVALFWGLVIMGIDRWLIVSMPVDGARKFAMAVPRLLLALLLGTLISTPLVLRIFQSEINAQLAVMQSGNYNTFLTQQNGSQVAKQVTAYGNELTQLNTVINSRGAQTGNSAEDPALKAYNSQLTTLEAQLGKETALRQQYYTQYRCQRYGGPGCPAGLGPAAKASLQSFDEADAQVTKLQGEINTVQGEIQARDAFLASTSKQDQLQRYQEAVQQRPVVQGEYNTAVQRKNQLQAAYYAQEQASHGILMRLAALSELSSQSPTVAGARLLLFLLFLVIECLPVTVKLLQQPGQYEAALVEAKAAERRDFAKAFAFRSRISGAARPGGPALLRLSPEPPAPDMGRIWDGGGGTRVLPIAAGDFEDQRPTEVYPDRGPDLGRPYDDRFSQRSGDFGAPDAQSRPYSGTGYHRFWGQRDDDARQAFGRASGQDGPGHDGSGRDSQAHSGSAYDGPAHDDADLDRTALDSPALDGTALDGPAQDGTALDGPARNGTAFDGTAFDGTAFDGTALDGSGPVPPTRSDVPARGGRPDPRAVAQTRVDHAFAADGVSSDGYLPMPLPEPDAGFRDQWPQDYGPAGEHRPLPAPAPQPSQPSAPAAAPSPHDGNGSGVPLDWGDE